MDRYLDNLVAPIKQHAEELAKTRGGTVSEGEKMALEEQQKVQQLIDSLAQKK
jgi:hypothetical protein